MGGGGGEEGCVVSSSVCGVSCGSTPTGKYHRLLTLVILFSGYLVSRGTHAPECRLQRGCRPKLHQDSKRQSVDEAKISGVERLCKITSDNYTPTQQVSSGPFA